MIATESPIPPSGGPSTVGNEPAGHGGWTRRDTTHLLALIALAGAMFFFNLGGRPLWDVDEGMHAATARAMVVSGDWLTPRFNGENFYDKPVLFSWFAAAAMVALGFTEFAVRLPAAVFGLGGVVVTYLLGRRLYGPTAALLGAVVLATSLEYLVLSRVVVHDIALCFFVLLALHLFWTGYADERVRTRCFLLLYVAVGLAVLAKGLLGIVLPGLVVVSFLVLAKQTRLIWKLRLGWGAAIVLGVAGPWYVAMMLAHDDYARYFFIEKHFGSFVSDEAKHPEPFYYYFGVIFGGLFPWSAFLPMALVHAVRVVARRAWHPTLFLLVAIGSMLLFLSAATSKLPTYILPTFPAAALLIGVVWSDLLTTPARELRRGFLQSTSAVLLLFGAGLIMLAVKPDVLPEADRLLQHVLKVLLLVVVGSGVTLALLLRHRHLTAFWSVAAMVMAFLVTFELSIAPAIADYRSSKRLAARLELLLPPGERIAVYGKFVGVADSALFYIDREAEELWSPEALREHLRSSTEPKYVVIDAGRLDQLDSVRDEFTIIDRIGNNMIATGTGGG